MIKYYGDIPVGHLDLMNELENLEKYVTQKGFDLPPLSLAKGYVSMAHDWFGMFMEEKGTRLLEMAEEAYPGYFERPIHNHIKSDPDFALVMHNFKLMPLGLKELRYYGFK